MAIDSRWQDQAYYRKRINRSVIIAGVCIFLVAVSHSFGAPEWMPTVLGWFSVIMIVPLGVWLDQGQKQVLSVVDQRLKITGTGSTFFGTTFWKPNDLKALIYDVDENSEPGQLGSIILEGSKSCRHPRRVVLGHMFEPNEKRKLFERVRDFLKENQFEFEVVDKTATA